MKLYIYLVYIWHTFAFFFAPTFVTRHVIFEEKKYASFFLEFHFFPTFTICYAILRKRNMQGFFYVKVNVLQVPVIKPNVNTNIYHPV